MCGRRLPAVCSAVAAALVVAAVAVVGVVDMVGPPGASAAGATYRLKQVELASGATTPARWNPCQQAIAWRVNFKGLRPARRPAMLTQLRQSFAKISRANGIRYRYAGTTGFVPRQHNLVSQPADIVVAVLDPRETDLNFTERSLGFGGVLWATWYGSKGEGAAVVRGYVVLRPSGLTTLKPGFGRGKRQGNVILHELGHATGLEHASSRAALMYPTLTASSPNGYTHGDLTGLATLGSKRGCIAVPARVDIKDYN